MPEPRTLALAGGAGVAVTAVAALHGPAHDSLTAHMVQHVLLLAVAAPLLALGARHRIPPALARPPVVLALVALQSAVTVAWHAPAAYDAALELPALHLIEHATFLGTACLAWAALVGALRTPHGGLPALALFVATLPSTVLGALMTLAARPWYPAYAGPDALDDQQLAGVVMWGYGGLAAVIGGVALFAAWLQGPPHRSVRKNEPIRSRNPHRTMVTVAAPALVLLLALVACSDPEDERVRVAGGSPSLGEEAIEKFGCGSCHTIPGVKGADALVGPPLDHFSKRTFIAGRLANTPDNLARWIRDPQGVEPGTAMPDLGVSREEARNIAAYLLSLD